MISIKEATVLVHASIPPVKWRSKVEELFIVFPVRDVKADGFVEL